MTFFIYCLYNRYHFDIKRKTRVKVLHVLNIFANRNFSVLEVEKK